jgi:hypothetical protein
MSRNWIPAFAGMALIACSSTTAIKPQVLTPPPSSSRGEFFVEKPAVQSREVGEEAWRRNATYGEVLAAALRSALVARGKTLETPPADIVRASVYVAFGQAPVTVKDQRKQSGHVEVRLQLLDQNSGAVLYSTHTLVPLPDSVLTRLGLGEDADAAIREALSLAAQDFASRL